MAVALRLFLLFLAIAPSVAAACVILEPLEAQLPNALKSSAYVFLGRVGSTVREPAQDRGFHTTLHAKVEVIETFKGDLKPGDDALMRLDQPAKNTGYWPAF